MYPSSLEQLIDSFKYLPGIGEKTAERLAFAIMEMDEERVSQFSNSLMMVKENIHRCPVCNGLTDSDKCSICSDDMRDNTILCVVEDPKSVFLFEKLGLYKGKYHVLKGLISPLDGINPDDIELEKLIERVKKESFKEIILAFKPSIEGETTALYIKKVLSGMNVIVTRLASGVPMGADMEYVDSLTLERALKDRKEIE